MGDLRNSDVEEDLEEVKLFLFRLSKSKDNYDFLWWWLSDGGDGDCLAMVKILLVILMRPKLKLILIDCW